MKATNPKNQPILKSLASIKPTSAWRRGVQAYALELVGSAEEPLMRENLSEVLLNGALGADYFEVPDYPVARLLAASPVLLAACRDALALLTNPDAESFDADAVIETLERAIAQAERGRNERVAT